MNAAKLLVQVQDADTVFVQARDAWDVVVGLSAAVVGLLAFVLLVGMVVVLVQIRNAARGVKEVKDRLGSDPGIQRLRNVAEHLDYITHSLRSDVQKVSGSVSRMSERIDQVSDRMEDRIEDFNALMEVLQDEAEGVFIDTASTVRGVKAGAERYRGRKERSLRAGDGSGRLPDGAPEGEDA